MSYVTVLNHPMAGNFMRILRDKKTQIADFRWAMEKLGLLLAVEATRSLSTHVETVVTPLEVEAECQCAEDNRVLLVPILRAGMGFLESFLTILPAAKVAQIGLSRDHDTLEASTYLDTVPAEPQEFDQVYILDPMLATGNSSIKALELIAAKGYKPEKIALVCGFAVKEGIAQINNRFPTVKIIAGVIDRELNENAYIVPGLGDAGDRLYLF
ncbi:MAG: uracil phosphoribosyltransferase [Candidatus Saccharibacteria bacterium]